MYFIKRVVFFMKMYFISDVHLMNEPIKNNFEVVPGKLSNFITYCRSLKGDYLVINGDLSSNPHMNERIKYEINKENDIKIINIPGNHEVYRGQPGSIGEYYKKYKRSEPYRSNNIDELIQINDDWSMLPALGSFDCMFKTELTIDEIESELKSGMIANAIKDSAILFFLEEQIIKWEEELVKSKSRNVIFAQHFVPHENLIRKKDGTAKFQGQTRMIGSKMIEEFIKRNKQIKIVHFGHSHIIKVDEFIDGVRYISSPVGYDKENENRKDYKNLYKENTIEIIL